MFHGNYDETRAAVIIFHEMQMKLRMIKELYQGEQVNTHITAFLISNL